MAKQDLSEAYKQERAAQLEYLKKEVNLIDLATQYHGYRITEGRGTETNVKLERGVKGVDHETLNVNRVGGILVYQNKNDDRDSGSVLDFVKKRTPGEDFGVARATLLSHAPGAPKAVQPRVEQVPTSTRKMMDDYAGLAPGEKRVKMLDDTTGGKGRPGQEGLVLKDATYLLSRGLSADTIKDEAFRGRVFTDQHEKRQFDRNGNPLNNTAFPMYNTQGLQSYELRNFPSYEGGPSYKSQMPSPGDTTDKGRDAVWASAVRKSDALERVVIGESPIDMMSKFQLEKEAARQNGEQMPNSRYLATGGSPSPAQLGVMEEIIARQNPRTVVLSNDNDVAGQAFNVNMIDAFRTPQQKNAAPELQQQVQQSQDQISWNAKSQGSGETKHLKMEVVFRHDEAQQGQDLTEQLRQRAAALGLPAQEPAEKKGMGLQQLSSSATETVVELRVSEAQRNAAVELAQQLRRDRETSLPAELRTPENFFVVERATGKDYNQDVLQAREAEQLQARRVEAGFERNQQVAEPQIAADINLNGSTSQAEIIEADRNRDKQVTDTELQAARFDRNQQQQQQNRANPVGVRADLDGDGIASSSEQRRADLNGDGIVTQSEVDTVRSRDQDQELEASRTLAARQEAAAKAEIEYAERIKAQRAAYERQEELNETRKATLIVEGPTGARERGAYFLPDLRDEIRNAGAIIQSEQQLPNPTTGRAEVVLNVAYALHQSELGQIDAMLAKVSNLPNVRVEDEIREARATELATRPARGPLTEREEQIQQRAELARVNTFELVVPVREGQIGREEKGQLDSAMFAAGAYRVSSEIVLGPSGQEKEIHLTGKYNLGGNIEAVNAAINKVAEREGVRVVDEAGPVRAQMVADLQAQRSPELVPVGVTNPLLTATVQIEEAAAPWPGALPTENKSLQLYGERVKEQLAEAGAEVNLKTTYPPVTETRVSTLSVYYQEGSEQQKDVADILRAAQVQGGGVQVQGIELPEQPAGRIESLDRAQPLTQLALTAVLREPNPEFEERLRATGAQVAAETIVGKPNGLIVLVDGTDATQLASMATVLAEKPAGVMVLEEPSARADRLRLTEAAREQGLILPAPEAARQVLAEAQPQQAIDRPQERPEPTPLPMAELLARLDASREAAPQVEPPAQAQQRVPAAERELAGVERRVLIEAPAAVIADVEGMISTGGGRSNFELQRQGPADAPTGLAATYRVTDSATERVEQQKVLDVLGQDVFKAKGVRIEEPEGQAQERTAALGAPSAPTDAQLVRGGALKAVISVQETPDVEDPGKRVGAIWKDLQNQGVGPTNIREKEVEQGTAWHFSIQYSPGNSNLAKINTVLETAAGSDGVQVLESADNRHERLSRGNAREAIAEGKRSPEEQVVAVGQQAKFKQEAAERYAATEPGQYEKLAISAPELADEKNLKALRADLKESGMEVAVQHRENQLAGPVVVLSFPAEHPSREALEQKLEGLQQRGVEMYDVKERSPYGTTVSPELEKGGQEAPVPQPAQLEAAAVEIGRTNIVERELSASLAAAASLRGMGDADQLSRPAQPEAAKAWVGTGPDLRDVDLYEKDASGMDFRGANLAGQDLRQTNISHADMRDTNLTGADMRGLDLTGTRLEGAVLTGVQLEGASRLMQDANGQRVLQDNLTPAQLTLAQPERGQEVAPQAAERTSEAVELTPVTAQQVAPVIEAQPAQTQQAEVQPAAVAAEPAAPVLQREPVAEPVIAPAVAAAVEPVAQTQGQGPELSKLTISENGQVQLNLVTPTIEAPTIEAPVVAAAGFSLPVESELTPEQKGTPLTPEQTVRVVSLSEQNGVVPVAASIEPAAPGTTPEAPGTNGATNGQQANAAEAKAPALVVDSMSLYEEAELNGTAARRVEVTVVQPLEPTDASQAQAAQVEALLTQPGARLEIGAPVPDEAAGTLSKNYAMVYANDDANLGQINKSLGEVAALGEQAGVKVELSDPSAENRQQALDKRIVDTPEALNKLASDLHDGQQQTGRVLIDRPAMPDVYMLEAAGAQVERVHLPTGPAALVTYALDRPEIASVVSVELDRIDRDAGARPAAGKTAEDVSGPILGEDQAQRRIRQQLATDAGLEVAARPRYEEGEIMAEQKRTRADFNAEAKSPLSAISGTLADGEQWRGSLREAKALEPADQRAMRDSWKEQTSTLTLLVEHAPGGEQVGNHAEKVAKALESTGAGTRTESLGVSPDTGLDRTLVHVSMEHNQPELAKFQATLRALSEQDSVQVPADGYWQREVLLGKGGSREAEPADIAREQRPWLEAAVAVAEPTPAERQGLAAAGARVEEELVNGKPVLMAYYNLDQPQQVGAISLALQSAGSEGRVMGEDTASRAARESRGEQLRADNASQTPALLPTPELEKGRPYASPAEQAAAVEEPGRSLSFVGRLREAVDSRLEQVRIGWEKSSPENLALIEAEQKGIKDRIMKEAYDRGWEKGGQLIEQAKAEQKAREAGVPVAEVGAAGIAAAVTAGAGSPGVKAEVFTEQTLRERRDDERTQPVQQNGPAEGKVLQTEQQVKPGIAEVAATRAAPAEQTLRPEGPAGAPAGAPVVVAAQGEMVELTPAAAPQLLDVERVRGVVLVEAKGDVSAAERAGLMQGFLAKNGLDARNVLPPPPGQTSPYSVPFSYNPTDNRIDDINKTLAWVQRGEADKVHEAPHKAQEPTLTPQEQNIARPYWAERTGQHNVAHIVVDDTTGQGRGPAERIKDELKSSGATVGEIKSDGHGKVEMDVSYHTHTPTIERINTTLDGAGQMNGVQVQETDQNKVARNVGAAAVEQRRERTRDSGLERD